jgi:ABC-type polar amino acid transport system ATPase subunit
VEGADGVMTTELDVDRLWLRRGPRDVLRDVTLTARRGEIVALMGLSGSGKTTVLRAIAALDPFEAGSIRVGEVALSPGPVASSTAATLRRRVGLVFQFHHLFEHLSALDNVCLAPIHAQGMPRHEARALAGRLLEDLGVGARARALPRELSGGEAQRVAIARAMAVDPRLLLLDEPTASLDPARRASLGETLRALAAGGRSLLMTSHDVDFVREYATTVVVLAGGAVIEQGDARAVLTSPVHEATRALLR